MDCRTAEQNITRFIQKELSDEETEEFLNHIRSCEECRQEMEMNYLFVEGMRLLDSKSDDFDVRGTMDRAVRAAWQHLRAVRVMKIARYSMTTLVLMSLALTLLLELRILYFTN